MFRFWVLGLFLFGIGVCWAESPSPSPPASTTSSQVRPVLIFDLDHTLISTGPRILAILHEIGVEQSLPQLQSLTLPDIELLRLGRLHLGLDSIFGQRVDGSYRRSPFGRRFYFDPSYLKFDSVMPGGPEFVLSLMQFADADVVYLTGRLEEYFKTATEQQLAYYNYPGFGSLANLSPRVRLILKSKDDDRSHEIYKYSVIQEFESSGNPVIAVFDDSKRNLNYLRQHLVSSTVLTRLTFDVSDQHGLSSDIGQITNFLVNVSYSRDLRRVNANTEQLKALRERINSVACERLVR